MNALTIDQSNEFASPRHCWNSPTLFSSDIQTSSPETPTTVWRFQSCRQTQQLAVRRHATFFLSEWRNAVEVKGLTASTAWSLLISPFFTISISWMRSSSAIVISLAFRSPDNTQHTWRQHMCVNLLSFNVDYANTIRVHHAITACRQAYTMHKTSYFGHEF